MQWDLHISFCRECYAAPSYDKNDFDENSKPKRKLLPKEAFADIAIGHGLASPDPADKTYRRTLDKMKKELARQGINKTKSPEGMRRNHCNPNGAVVMLKISYKQIQVDVFRCFLYALKFFFFAFASINLSRFS